MDGAVAPNGAHAASRRVARAQRRRRWFGRRPHAPLSRFDASPV